MAVTKITEQQIIDAGLNRLAQCVSLESLSLRQVARRLNVDVSTLYWHFENKQALLQAMANEIAQKIELPVDQPNWQAQLEQFFTNVFDTYVKYPHSAELMMNTVPSSLTRLKLIDYAIGILVDAGFSEQDSNRAMTSIDFLLTGLVIDLSTENKFRHRVQDNQDDYLSRQIDQVHSLAKQAELTHMQNSIKMRNQLTVRKQFEQGMRLIVRGMEK